MCKSIPVIENNIVQSYENRPSVIFTLLFALTREAQRFYIRLENIFVDIYNCVKLLLQYSADVFLTLLVDLLP